MKLTRLVDNYINEKDFSIQYKKGKLDIVNYSEIIDFSSTRVRVRYCDKTYDVLGDNLIISKMVDNELLVEGDISEVTFS